MIAHFSLWLVSGMSLTWCLMPRRQVTSGFFRIQMLVALGLCVLSALTLGKFPASQDGHLPPLLPVQAGIVLCILTGVAAFLGSVMWTLERRRAGSWLAGVIFVLSLAALLLTSPRLGTLSHSGEQLRLLSDVTSAALLGSMLTAMLLGHWYLTAPAMSIEPLKRLNCYVGIAGGMRLLLSAVGLVLAWDGISGDTHWMWLSLRWIAGIFGTLLVAGMVWRILKYRNTQAATGVLFVGVILSFIGEMTGVLLYRVLSTPL